MKSFVVREIPAALGKQVKSQAAAQGMTLNAVMHALIRGYAEGKIKIKTEAK